MEMDLEQNKNHGFDCASHEEIGVLKSSVDVLKANGTAADIETCSSEVRSCLRTYKRRKKSKDVKDVMGSDESESELGGKSMKNSCGQDSKERSHAHGIAPDGWSLNHQRDVVLEQICDSLESDGSLRKCIQDALVFHPESGSRTSLKEFVHSCESWSKYTFPDGSFHDGHQNSVKGSVDMKSTGSNQDNFTELCRRTLFDIIISEKFGQLCTLLLENGIKAEKLIDLSLINSRMKNRAYESSPLLFHSDFQQIWTKLHQMGTDMTAMAKYLSDITTTSFHEKVRSSVHSISEKLLSHQHTTFLTKESNFYKADLTGSDALNPVHMCPHCRKESNGRNGLVCDLFEEMYHISCISPPVHEIISLKNWYCVNCTAKGIESPHDDCTACERLNTGRPPHCTVCRTEVTDKEEYRICGHSLCSHKFYHAKCLKSKQLSYGPCWHCPSCLCRNCLVDKDDDKIVLCDGCDHAYHIYCMKPPRSTVPRGKWFCTKCEAGVQHIHKAKLSYESLKGKVRKRSFDGKLKSGEGFKKAGGVDMLLNAAKSLNFEEKMFLEARL